MGLGGRRGGVASEIEVAPTKDTIMGLLEFLVELLLPADHISINIGIACLLLHFQKGDGSNPAFDSTVLHRKLELLLPRTRLWLCWSSWWIELLLPAGVCSAPEEPPACADMVCNILLLLCVATCKPLKIADQRMQLCHRDRCEQDEGDDA